jgi:hypothetical protein
MVYSVTSNLSYPVGIDRHMHVEDEKTIPPFKISILLEMGYSITYSVPTRFLESVPILKARLRF